MATDPAGRRRLTEYLARQQPADRAEFAPKDDDELNAALITGRFRRVVFADVDAVLSMLWKGHADLDRWIASGVRIELAQSLPGCEEHWLPCLHRVSGNLAHWRRIERRRKTLAAALLSLLALLSAAAVLFVAAR